LNAAKNLGSEIPDLSFTKDGLNPILNSARTNYLLGTVYASCGKAEDSKNKFESAASASSTDQVRWGRLAAQKLPGFDEQQWQSRLQKALEDAVERTETSAYPSWWMYTAGMLERDLGKKQEANAKFRRALLLPDRMLAYHLTRLAQLDTSRK